ncbi:MAG: hypothetical protein IJJ77_04770 [Paludibacteraceae bacterium]|nr:hypothetical protein [Paludibacteraceae bacterium]MBR2262683.1 hypothetical protein [Paludibacteraceae bacterium]
MSILSKIFSLQGARELTYAGDAVSDVRSLLNLYERDNDFAAYLCTAAWITQVGLIDTIERNNWPMQYKMMVDFDGHLTRISMAEAMLHTVRRIRMKLNDLPEEKANFINEIFEKGKAFYIVKQNLPQSILDKYNK